MQAQQTLTVSRHSFSTLVAVVATLFAAVLAIAIVATAERSATPATRGAVAVRGIGAEQIAHDRSGAGLGAPRSIGSSNLSQPIRGRAREHLGEASRGPVTTSCPRSGFLAARPARAR